MSDRGRSDRPGAGMAGWLWPDLVIAAAIVVLVAAVYAQVRGFAFITFDDISYVVENRQVMSGLSWANVLWALTALEMNNWHPLTWLSHMADAQMFGAWAGGHHLSSVFWHAANSVLLFALLCRWGVAAVPAGLIAALFAAHPMHVESVAWVAERKDVLSTFFCLLTLHFYQSYVAGPGALRYLVVTLAFVLGLMAKPMLVSLPVLLLLLDVWPHRRLPLAGPAGRFAAAAWPLLREKLPWVAITLVSIVITLKAQDAAMMPAEIVGAEVRLGNALRAYGVYLWMTVWPADLSFFYPIYPVKAWQLAATSVALAAFSVWAWRERQREPALLVGWLWFLVTLLPVVGIVKVGAQAYADRYVYIPHIGLFLGVGVWLAGIAGRHAVLRRPLVAFGGCAVLACAALAWQQTRYWQDSETLYRQALRIDPRNAFAETMLTETYFVFGPRERAEAMAARIIGSRPGAAAGLTGYAFDAIRAGRYDEAISRCRAVLSVLPSYAPALQAMGQALHASGDALNALPFLQAAVNADPARASAWQALARLLAVVGQGDASAQAAEQARRLDAAAQARRDLARRGGR